jgi:hypothetical protein
MQDEVKVLNETGARIWALVDGQRTLREIIAVLVNEYAVESTRAERDALAFVADLCNRALLRLA